MKTRKEIYAEITALGLQETVKKMYGRNFTQVRSKILARVIEKAKAPKETAPTKVTAKKVIPKPIKKATTTKTPTVDSTTFDVGASTVDKLIHLLVKKRILLKSEVDSLRA